MEKFQGKIRARMCLHIGNVESTFGEASLGFLEKVVKSSPKVLFSHVRSMEGIGALRSWRTLEC